MCTECCNKFYLHAIAKFGHDHFLPWSSTPPLHTAIVNGHGNIKTYLYKNQIIESPMCSCKEEDQSVDHILFDCKPLEHDRDRLKAAVTRSENWPVNKDTHSIKFYKFFKEFTNNIILFFLMLSIPLC